MCKDLMELLLRKWRFSNRVSEGPLESIQKGGRPTEQLNSCKVFRVSVMINLPYKKVVYGLDDKSINAQRIAKCRLRKRRKVKS